jgi:hypothetical protein
MTSTGHKLKMKARKEYNAVAEYATANGMQLTKSSDELYRLQGGDGWIVEIYPGAQRLYRTFGPVAAPEMEVTLSRGRWSLWRVVKAAVEAVNDPSRTRKDSLMLLRSVSSQSAFYEIRRKRRENKQRDAKP